MGGDVSQLLKLVEEGLHAVAQLAAISSSGVFRIINCRT
jgi:hypothetical protein